MQLSTATDRTRHYAAPVGTALQLEFAAHLVLGRGAGAAPVTTDLQLRLTADYYPRAATGAAPIAADLPARTRRHRQLELPTDLPLGLVADLVLVAGAAADRHRSSRRSAAAARRCSRGGGIIVADVVLDPCPGCPAAYAAAPATVRHNGNGDWNRMPDDTPAHLLALFRDPQVQDGRRVDVVLGLPPTGDPCRAPRWLREFRRSLAELPVGLVVTLDNGVRCPCGKASERSTYVARADVCLGRTRTCLAALRHPDGGRPGVVICDRDLVDALAATGTLALGTGAPWTSPERWITTVGTEVTFLDEPALVLAHPIVLQYRPAYRDAVAAAVPKLVALARTTGSSAKIMPT